MGTLTRSRRLEVELERWPLRQPFAISRHVFIDSLALTVHLHEAGHTGRGECEPHEFEQVVGLEAQTAVLHQASQPGWLDGLSSIACLARPGATRWTVRSGIWTQSAAGGEPGLLNLTWQCVWVRQGRCRRFPLSPWMTRKPWPRPPRVAPRRRC
jgi:hypothetical protein